MFSLRKPAIQWLYTPQSAACLQFVSLLLLEEWTLNLCTHSLPFSSAARETFAARHAGTQGLLEAWGPLCAGHTKTQEKQRSRIIHWLHTRSCSMASNVLRPGIGPEQKCTTRKKKNNSLDLFFLEWLGVWGPLQWALSLSRTSGTSATYFSAGSL